MSVANEFPTVQFKRGAGAPSTFRRVQSKGKEIIVGATEYTYQIATVAAIIYHKHGYSLVITSVCEGKHSANSLHYQGRALDLRINMFKNVEEEAKVIGREIAEALGNDYDVVLEVNHLHIEYDPKERPKA